jgi:hypothetical protein
MMRPAISWAGRQITVNANTSRFSIGSMAVAVFAKWDMFLARTVFSPI